MANLSKEKRAIIYLVLFLLNFILFSNVKSQEQNHVFYPSVLSLNNKGIAVVEADGIHFYDSDKKRRYIQKNKIRITYCISRRKP